MTASQKKVIDEVNEAKVWIRMRLGLSTEGEVDPPSTIHEVLTIESGLDDLYQELVGLEFAAIKEVILQQISTGSVKGLLQTLIEPEEVGRQLNMVAAWFLLGVVLGRKKMNRDRTGHSLN